MSEVKELGKIGWKEEWKSDPEKIVRLVDLKVLTVNIVLILLKVFSGDFTELFSSLERFVPLGFSFPNFPAFKKKLERMKKSKANLSKCKSRSEHEMAKYNDFLSSPFFTEKSALPVSHSCSSTECQVLKLQLQTLEREKKSLEKKISELDSRLVMEQSRSNDLSLRVSELESSNDTLS